MLPFTQSQTCPVIAHHISHAEEYPPGAMKIASKLGGSDSSQLDTTELFRLALGCSRMLTNHRALELMLPLLSPDPSKYFILYLLGQLLRELVPEGQLLYDAAYSRAAYPCSVMDGVGKYFPQHGLADFVATLPLAIGDIGSVEGKVHECSTEHSSPISYELSISKHSGLESEGLHWLAGQEVTAYVVQLPLFFLASKEEMFDVMASILCHRRACGIGGPVLGIAYESSGTVLQAVIGWSEVIKEGNATCSQVHVAYASQVNANVGVFDLADPYAVRSFTMFLYNHLREVYSTVQSHHIIPQPDSQHWRLDCADGTASHDTIRERVMGWLGETNFADHPEHSLSSLYDNLSTASATSTKSSNRGRAKFASTKYSDKGTLFVNSLTWEQALKWPLIGIIPSLATLGAPSARIHKFVDSDKHEVISIPRRRCNNIDRMVCSVSWPPPSPRNPIDNGPRPVPPSHEYLAPYLRSLLGTYAIDRHITIEPGKEGNSIVFEDGKPPESLGNTKLYEGLPPSLSVPWNKFHNTLSVEEALREFTGFEAIQALSEQEQVFLTKHFSRIIDISNRVRSETKRQTDEAEYRQYWDAVGGLLHLPMDSDEEQPLYRLKQKIPFSRNCYFDKLSGIYESEKEDNAADRRSQQAAVSFYKLSIAMQSMEETVADHYLDTIPPPETNPDPLLLKLVPGIERLRQTVYQNFVDSVLQHGRTLFEAQKWRIYFSEYNDIKARVIDDPDVGVSDACVLLRILDAFPPILLKGEAERIRNFQIARAPAAASPAAAPAPPPVRPNVDEETDSQALGKKPGVDLEFRSSHILGNQVSFEPSPASKDLPDINVKVSPNKTDPSRALLLTLIYWEFKKGGGSFEQGLAQARQDLTSGVRHLAAVGIDRMPVFAIVTNGLRGICLAGWGEPDPKAPDGPVRVFIADHNCPAYDIRDPAQAIRYFCFLIRIRFTYAPRMRAQFESIKERFQQRWKAKDPSLDWTMENQREGNPYKAAHAEYKAQYEEVKKMHEELEAAQRMREEKLKGNEQRRDEVLDSIQELNVKATDGEH